MKRNQVKHHHLLLVICVWAVLFAQSASAQTADMPKSLKHSGDGWRKATAELEEKGVLGSGGLLVFEENYAFFSGAGNFVTPLSGRNPHTDIVMGGELTYQVGNDGKFETCALSARIVTERNTITETLQVGLTSEGDLYYYDYDGSKDTGDFHSGIDLNEPHQILFLAISNRLTVYLDGTLIFDKARIDERSGVYGIALNSSSAKAKCEARDLWVYQAIPFEQGVCKIVATKTVNKRTGAGADNPQAGKLKPSDTVFAVAQAQDNDGITWWQLEDETWVRGDVVTAMGDCRSLKGKAPDVSEVISQGETHMDAEEYDAAVDDFTQAIALDPTSAEAYLKRGTAYLWRGDFDLGIEDLSHALELQPDLNEAFYYRGIAYRVQEKYTEAIADFNHIIELDPDNRDGYYERGYTYYYQGEYDLAVDDLTHIINGNYLDAGAFLMRGIVYNAMLEKDRAARDLSRWVLLKKTREINRTMKADDPLTVAMHEGYVYRISFEGKKGQIVNVTAEGNGEVDPLIVLVDANDEPLVGDDDGGRGSDAAFSNFAIPATGEYFLLVTHAGGDNEGDIEVTLTFGAKNAV